MTKRETINEMANVVPEKIKDPLDNSRYIIFGNSLRREIARIYYNAGYRKTFTSDLASDTQKAYKEGYDKGFLDGREEFDIILQRNKQLIQAREISKSDIERLKTQLQQANAGIVNCSGCHLVELNAVKDFANKLKDKAVDFLYSATVDGRPGFDIHISELCHMIDELLKECLND